MDTVLLFGRTFLALAIVLLLIWAMSRLAHRGQNTSLRRRVGRPTGANIEVLSKKSLSRTSAVALIRVGEHNLIVGSTPQSVTLISEIPTGELELDDRGDRTDALWTAPSEHTPLAWDAFISKLRELTVRS
jgi:flagellar biogenesis protein FliO